MIPWLSPRIHENSTTDSADGTDFTDNSFLSWFELIAFIRVIRLIRVIRGCFFGEKDSIAFQLNSETINRRSGTSSPGKKMHIGWL